MMAIAASKAWTPKSDVETYFKVALELTHPRWQGVPIFIEAGKRVVDPKRAMGK